MIENSDKKQTLPAPAGSVLLFQYPYVSNTASYERLRMSGCMMEKP